MEHNFIASFLWMIVFFSTYLFFMVSAVVVVRSRRWKLEEIQNKSSFGIKSALKILDRSDRFMLLSRIGHLGFAITTGVFLGYLTNTSLLDIVAKKLPGWLHFISITLFIILAISLALLFSQIFRNLALTYPEKILRFIARPLILLNALLDPFIVIIYFCVGKLLKLFSLKYVQERMLAHEPEDISEIIEESSEKITEHDREMLQSVIEISDTLVEEVMTTRKDIVKISINASLEDIINIYSKEAVSRLLVTGENLDDVKGILIAKDLIPLISNPTKDFRLVSYLRPALRVSGKMKVNKLLAMFRNNATHFAVVLDEHGGVDGIVTVEDLLEEIVGEIFDEHDLLKDFQGFKEIERGTILAAGNVLIDDLNKEFDFKIPVGEYDTIAGFVMHQLGRIPKVGDLTQSSDLKIFIEAMEQNRVTRVRIVKADIILETSPLGMTQISRRQ